MVNRKSDTKIDEVWAKLNAEHHLIDTVDTNGFADIKAETIKRHYEPRLSTKFDTEAQLPLLFRDHGLGLLSISRSMYRIGRFDAFLPFDTSRATVIEQLERPPFQTLGLTQLSSESSAILNAWHAGLYQELTDEKTLNLTFFGRTNSGIFTFQLPDTLN